MSKTETVNLADYKARLIGVLASAAGNREISIEGQPGVTVSDFISKLLLQVNKRQFSDLLIDSATNNPLPNVIILLNDQDCNLFEGLETKIKPGTLVTIIPVAHGG